MPTAGGRTSDARLPRPGVHGHVVHDPARELRDALLQPGGPVGRDPPRARQRVDLGVGGLDDRVDDLLRVDTLRLGDLGDRLPVAEVGPQLLHVDVDRVGRDLQDGVAERPAEAGTVRARRAGRGPGHGRGRTGAPAVVRGPGRACPADDQEAGDGDGGDQLLHRGFPLTRGYLAMQRRPHERNVKAVPIRGQSVADPWPSRGRVPRRHRGGPIARDGRTSSILPSAMSDHDDAARYAAAAGELLLDLRAQADGDDWARWSLGDAGDVLANRHLLELLRDEHPDDAVLSEESADDPRRLDALRVWIIDPLDGTREFTELGRSDWAVHVALWERGRGLTAGAVALPAV